MREKYIAVLIFFLTLAGNSFSQLSNGLKAYYPFEANLSDQSGNGNDGLLIGSPMPTQDRFGITDCAYYFPGGSNDYIRVNFSPDFAIDSLGAFSISLWYQGGSVNEGDYEILFEKPNPDVSPYPSDYTLALYDLNKPGLGSNYRPIVGAVFDPPIPDPDWHHVVGIYDSKNWYFYEDNILVQSETSQEYSIFQSMNDLVIGKRFQGVIDDIRFYNRAISFSEINEIFHLPSSCIPTGTKEMDNIQYAIYPNPTKDILHISSSNQMKTGNIAVFNSLGKKLIDKPNYQFSVDMLNVSEWPEGIYFVQIYAQQQKSVTKLVKLK